ncbi:hypothetical protein AYO52_11070 [Dietzia sp. 111N12-1]|nr:hypothetical protein AYO52_11070 [Dietzia sp. 111N12-1]
MDPGGHEVDLATVVLVERPHGVQGHADRFGMGVDGVLGDVVAAWCGADGVLADDQSGTDGVPDSVAYRLDCGLQGCFGSGQGVGEVFESVYEFGDVRLLGFGGVDDRVCGDAGPALGKRVPPVGQGCP